MIDALQAIYDFLVDGSYDFFQDVFLEMSTQVVIWYFKAKAAGLELAWDIASSFLSGLNLTALIQQYWGDLDSSIVSFCVRYKIVDGFNLIINALATRFIWRMM